MTNEEAVTDATTPEFMGLDEAAPEAYEASLGADKDRLAYLVASRLGACTLCGALVFEATQARHIGWHRTLGTGTGRVAMGGPERGPRCTRCEHPVAQHHSGGCWACGCTLPFAGDVWLDEGDTAEDPEEQQP